MRTFAALVVVTMLALGAVAPTTAQTAPSGAAAVMASDYKERTSKLIGSADLADLQAKPAQCSARAQLDVTQLAISHH